MVCDRTPLSGSQSPVGDALPGILVRCLVPGNGLTAIFLRLRMFLPVPGYDWMLRFSSVQLSRGPPVGLDAVAHR